MRCMTNIVGLQRWRENLQLLVPFLIEPRIVLFSLTETSDLADSNASKRLKVRTFSSLSAPPSVGNAYS